MKKIYHLKPEFYQHFETADEPIIWVYRLGEDVIYSVALNELVTKYYFEN